MSQAPIPLWSPARPGNWGLLWTLVFVCPAVFQLVTVGFWWGCLSQLPITPTREPVTSVWLVVVPQAPDQGADAPSQTHQQLSLEWSYIYTHTFLNRQWLQKKVSFLQGYKRG